MFFGVNLAGAEFGDSIPGVHGEDYIYPGPASFDYFLSRDLRLIRLPFKWERLQRRLNGPLDEAELALMNAAVGHARERGMKVILDAHNYARYRDRLIGSPAVPCSAFKNFWRRVAFHFKDNEAIYAYGLMNEPHDTGELWPAAAQAGVDGVRTEDRRRLILVPGDGWSGAWHWHEYNAGLSVHDPGGNHAFEAHQYFDRDGSGTYKGDYDAEDAYPDIGVDRLMPFLTWLTERKACGFLGEYGVPDDDPRWLVVLDKFLNALEAAGVGGTYWAAGPWWGDYPLSVEPRNGRDRPQMKVLTKYIVAQTAAVPP